MTSKLTGLTTEELTAHEAKWGRYNDCPSGFIEITAEEFAHSGFFIWCIEMVEHRQILNRVPKGIPFEGMLSITLFFMNNGIHFGIANDYQNKKVRYFKFAKCFHNYVEISAAEAGKPAFRNYHYYKCTLCGDQTEMDSSD